MHPIVPPRPYGTDVGFGVGTEWGKVLSARSRGTPCGRHRDDLRHTTHTRTLFLFGGREVFAASA
ncbi:hypothetical protein ACWEGM_17605, partial [Streptomyces nigra]